MTAVSPRAVPLVWTSQTQSASASRNRRTGLAAHQAPAPACMDKGRRDTGRGETGRGPSAKRALRSEPEGMRHMPPYAADEQGRIGCTIARSYAPPPSARRRPVRTNEVTGSPQARTRHCAPRPQSTAPGSAAHAPALAGPFASISSLPTNVCPKRHTPGMIVSWNGSVEGDVVVTSPSEPACEPSAERSAPAGGRRHCPQHPAEDDTTQHAPIQAGCGPAPTHARFADDARPRSIAPFRQGRGLRAGRQPRLRGQGATLRRAASTASPNRSTIMSTSAAVTMYGGAMITWSPRLPSIVPPIG